MSRRDNLISRLQSRPKDFTWGVLQRLLEGQVYEMVNQGKTGGSNRRFIHLTAATITLHKSHPGKILKMYALDDVLGVLKRGRKSRSKPFKGAFNVRTGTKLHRQAALYAKQQGLHFNSVMIDALKQFLPGNRRT